MRLLIITSVEAEAHAISSIEDVKVIVCGVGRTNAAAATVENLMRFKGFDAVISAGVAGALPGSGLAVGDPLIASSCIYAEEGLITPTGFVTMSAIGFPLGDFEGNRVPVDDLLLDALGDLAPIGPIATVATCSGTDAAAAEVVHRTGALAEAMEGAAVVHAARRMNVRAIEIRAISNSTGDRTSQRWDIPKALAALTQLMTQAVAALRA